MAASRRTICSNAIKTVEIFAQCASDTLNTPAQDKRKIIIECFAKRRGRKPFKVFITTQNLK